MTRLLTAPTTTYVDSNGRFWRNIPGLTSVVFRIDADHANAPVCTLAYATAKHGLTALDPE